ncbi:ferredoxin [Amycolatopsis sp. MtRt-6]|uniref:ferredoxin n=1 Tax=Amycolatopsis sp. MtRt-6 TaxID=2792782 RepID=UPI001A8FF961|nr:ferredoxin [Amycolatopsis sp. MtRt-6]
MTTPPVPLGPEQQQQLVNRIGHGLASLAPPGTWRQVRAEYRAAGRHIEADVVVTGQDGVPRAVQPPPELLQLLGTLRAGMYRPGAGTWLGAVLTVDPGQGVGADFGFDREPRWRRTPPPIGFQDELRLFPRADQQVPDWLRRRAAGPSGEEGVRTPRIYDGLDASGRPLVRRPPVAPAEAGQLLAYLDAAPVILASRSNGPDAFAPDRTDAVPLNFRTDGVWAWPGAVAYYLREHGVPPDPELVAHIRARRYTAPDEVSEAATDLALAAITQ